MEGRKTWKRLEKPDGHWLKMYPPMLQENDRREQFYIPRSIKEIYMFDDFQ